MDGELTLIILQPIFSNVIQVTEDSLRLHSAF